MKRYFIYRDNDLGFDFTEDPRDGEWVRYDDLPQWSSDMEACPWLDTVILYCPGLSCNLITGWKQSSYWSTEPDAYHFVCGYVEVFPTHWMPLPEGPK